MMTHACWLLPLLLLSFIWLARHYQLRLEDRRTAATAKIQRLLKPRTPTDCSACRQQLVAPLGHGPPGTPVMPWREHKSRRGAPKRIPTQGFACPRPSCVYYRITDAQVHALVGDGAHGKTERIQTFRCPVCRSTYSVQKRYLGSRVLLQRRGQGAKSVDPPYLVKSMLAF